MALKLYYDLLSQPSRALFIFLKKCEIPFEPKLVALGKGEQYTPEYAKINRFNKVPAIQHSDFNLAESVGILRYLCREFKVSDHWYPRDSKAQAKVDEYLEWQHLNTRMHCAYYFWFKFMIPRMTNTPARPDEIAEFESRMIECLDQVENIWLKDTPYLVGDKISIADLLGACEIEQPRIAGFNPLEGRPKLTAWMNRVKADTNPYYEEAHAILEKLAAKAQNQETQSKL